MALKLNETYPGRFNNPSAGYPQGSFKNRTAPGAEDGSYFEQQWANDHLAFLSSLLDGAGVVADGSVDSVGSSQYYSALLSVITANNNDKFNSAIVTIPSAANIDLTALATDTSQITISGSAAITGFTVAAGRAFVVKFSGACTLTNNASIVTGSGANIITAAGDSCIIRSTAANTVEILAFTRGGVLQSKTANGYRFLHDGTDKPIIMQWGVSAAIVQNGSTLVTLPVTLSTEILYAGACYSQDPAANNTTAALSVLRTSLSQITITKGANGGGTEDLLAMQWFVLGY